MRKPLKAAVGLGAVAGLVMAAAAGQSASADTAPQSHDVTVVGSDTAQFLYGFGADGDVSADPGYNTTAKIYRLMNIDATADATGRSLYANGSTVASPIPGNPAVIGRAGKLPVFRPNGTGNGLTNFLNDATVPFYFNVVRGSRPPKASEIATATNAAHASFGGGIHTYQLADDSLLIAYNKSGAVPSGQPVSCIPAAGLTGNDLVHIYNSTGLGGDGVTFKTWGDLYTADGVSSPGGTCATDAIVPAIPQTGSGTHDDFVADLKTTYNGGSAIVYTPIVITTEEHDPAAITGTTARTDANGNPVRGPEDAISPFSVGRYNLIQTGYFDQQQRYNGGTSLVYKDAIQLSSGPYVLARHLFAMVRQADVTTATPFLPGGALNWVQTFFDPATGWFCKSANAGLFTAAGVTQDCVDKGLNYSVG